MDELRVIVLFEDEAGFFRQVMLDAEQFKALSDLISHPTNDFDPAAKPTPDVEFRCVPFRPDWTIDALHLGGLPSSYPAYPRAPPIDD